MGRGFESLLAGQPNLCMDSSIILADLREQFGARKVVLYAEELAIALHRTTSAVYTLKSRGTLPVPCFKVGGRLAVSIYDVADWLAGNTPKTARSKPQKNAEVSVPEPKRPKADMGDFLMQVRAQRKFLAELELAIQYQLEQAGASPVHTVSLAVFDDQPDLFFIEANGLVLAYARDEDADPLDDGVDLEWLTWTAALARPWQNEDTRIGWLDRAETFAAGTAALVEAEREAILRRI